MQYKDFELLAGIGRSDCEYLLGIGARLDDPPPWECTQPSPKHQVGAGNHICIIQGHTNTSSLL
jgi:hypothetical protein